MTNNFNQPVTQWDFCACFLRTISEILGTVVERDTPHVGLANQSRSMFYFIDIIEENPASHRQAFWNGVITSYAGFDCIGNSSPNPHHILEKLQLQEMNLEYSIV